MQRVFITGADRGVGYALCERFVSAGWRVIAGQYMPDWMELAALQAAYPDCVDILPLDVADTESVAQAAAETEQLLAGQPLDMLISCAGISPPDNSPHGLSKTLNTNAVAAIRMVDHFLPLMAGGLMRLCFVSSEAGSIAMQHRTGGSFYCMSKSALNMAVRMLFNRLQPQGFTFRLYHPGWVRSYMQGRKSEHGNFEPAEAAEAGYKLFCAPQAAEDVLVMTDISDMDWPF